MLRPCTTSAGFTAVPDTPMRLDMARLKADLVGKGYAVVLDAAVILIVRKGVESSLYDTGKVLLKTTDAALAQSAYDELAPAIAAATRPARRPNA